MKQIRVKITINRADGQEEVHDVDCDVEEHDFGWSLRYPYPITCYMEDKMTITYQKELT